MPVAAFSFTNRAVPIAEIGRIQPVNFAADEFTETWVDIGCDVHTVTTDTGRGSASDLFNPGTAVMTASNVTGWADGTVPLEWSYFNDDFVRTGPALGSRWESWPALIADQGADDLILVDEGAEVQHRPSAPAALFSVEGGCELIDTSSGFGATATTATVGPFTGVAVGDLAVVALARDGGTSSPAAITGWDQIDLGTNPFSATWQHDIFTHRVTGEEAAVGDPWTATWPVPAPWSWVGWVVRGVNADSLQIVGGSSNLFPSGITGFYEARLYTPFTTDVAGCVVARLMAGNSHRDVVEGGVTELVHPTSWTATQLLAFDSGGDSLPVGTSVTHRTWNWTAAAIGDEWATGLTLLFTPGPAPNPDSVPMEGASCALWGQSFAGNQFVDISVTGLAAPDKVWPLASTNIELALFSNNADLAGAVASFQWLPAWDDPANTGRLNWSLIHRAAGGGNTTVASGHVDFGADGFPEPARFRFEADTTGAYRAYFQGALLGSGTDSSPPTGDLIGVYAYYFAGALSYGRTHQPGPPRFESIAGGSNIPAPIYLEPGVLIRIGVDHQVYGTHWLFHGYVDAIVPVYDPTRTAVASIECIDALGEIGRLPIADIGGNDPEEAWERVWRLIEETGWPTALSDVDDDATWMENQSAPPDRAIDMLTQTAESCGGAMYGDPENGHVTFRARDWQAWDIDDPPHGYITNGPTPAGTEAFTACPSTWERSWRREEMTTRATLTGGTNVKTGVQEKRFYSDPAAETRYGVEAYTKKLVCIEGRILDKLGHRQLKLRGPAAFPRVAAVLLDAATGSSSLDLMTLSTFTLPSRYRCGLVTDGHTVFDRQYLVTGLRHTIERDSWTCRLELDIADVFATKGARWGRGHWSRPGDVWGHSI